MMRVVEKGTAPTHRPAREPGDPNGGKGKKGNGGSSTPGGKPSGGRGKNAKAGGSIEPLNPPFDPRMRRVGSPLNQTQRIKRGWIQNVDADKRVNFLFNPSQLDVQSSIDPNYTVSPYQKGQTDDVTSPFYTGVGVTLGVKLLYDRTYELFSGPKNDRDKSMANFFGVWADVAAWYTYVGMLEEMPTSWDEGFLTAPPQVIPSYLFIGPRLAYYGWPTSVNVTYSHWTQNMVPARCAVDVGFLVLPHVGTPLANVQGATVPNVWGSLFSSPPEDSGGWLSDLNGWVQENFG